VALSADCKIVTSSQGCGNLRSAKITKLRDGLWNSRRGQTRGSPVEGLILVHRCCLEEGRQPLSDLGFRPIHEYIPVADSEWIALDNSAGSELEKTARENHAEE
jgi:hypothetical protein